MTWKQMPCVFECEVCGQRVNRLYRRMGLKWICEDCAAQRAIRPKMFIEASFGPRVDANARMISDEEEAS